MECKLGISLLMSGFRREESRIKKAGIEKGRKKKRTGRKRDRKKKGQEQKRDRKKKDRKRKGKE